jgi:hypothetical protein
MRITRGESNFSFAESVKGKVVIARVDEDKGGAAGVRVAELLRVGSTMSLDFWNADEFIYFHKGQYTPVKPKLINCTEIGVGKGWEGFYDQAPVKRSSFRV